MACRIQIKKNLRDQATAMIPEDYTSLGNKALTNIAKEINTLFKDDIVYFRPTSGDSFIKIVNPSDALVKRVYDAQIADENNIAANERIKLSEEANEKIDDEGNIYFQTESNTTEQPNKALNEQIGLFLSKLGITTINVEQIRDAQGNPMKAVAVADMLNRVIEVVENKADISTLPEEAAHFFVEMLADTGMMNNMMNKIVNYQVYQDVINNEVYQKQYKGNEEKLRKEAIGKLIAQHIIGKQPIENENRAVFTAKWWNALWDRIKSIFGKAGTNEFKLAASKILAGDISNLGALNSKDRYYQTNNEQEKIVDNLDNKFNITLNEEAINEKTGKKGVYELVTQEGLKKIYNRVSDRITAYMSKKGFSERTAKEKLEDEVRRVEGSKGHADIQNIITRIVESYNGVTTTQRTAKLNDIFYNRLEEHFKQFIAAFPPGTKFYTEKTIYDEATNEAGTIDFMAVLPDGKVDLYDWKFVEFKNKDANGRIISTSVPWYKEEAYNIQLTRYRKILQYNYNVKEFGKTRVIPISASYKKNILTDIQIGNKTIDGKDRAYLNPVPIRGIAGGEVELTGNKQLDDIISVLIQKRESLMNKTQGTAEGKIKKAERLERINEAIKGLQLEGDIKAFLDDAIFELKYINNVGIENLSLEDLIKAKELVDYYSDLKKKNIVDYQSAKKYEDLFTKVTNNSQELYSRIYGEYEKRVKEIAESKGVTNIDEAQKETGFMSRLFRTISQSNHPIIKTFYGLLTSAKDKIYKDTEQINTLIKAKIDNLEKWGAARGYKGSDIFKEILQFKDGKWTGNLIPKWNSEFFKNREEAIKSKNTKWISENTVFNEEGYKELLQKNIGIWTKMYAGDVDGQAKIDKRLIDFNNKYNVKTSANAYLNKSNYFLSPILKWKSEELNNLEKPENKPLKEFYDLFTETITSFKAFLPLDVNGNFIPNIKNDFLDQIAQNGTSSVKGLGNSILNHLDAKSDGTIGMVDELTGERIKQVPLLYTNTLDADSKSKDLGKVLSIFAEMAYNYKYMSEIESASIILKDVLANSKQILTTSNGEELLSKVTGKTAEVAQSSETLEQFNDYMDHYLYGIKTKNKDATYKLFGKELSGIKTFSGALSYFSTKALAGNLVSGLANGIGGVSNAFFEGAKSRFYNNSEYKKGLAMMSSANTKAYAAMNFWDIESSENAFKKANRLSVSAISKTLTLDKLHFLQRGGDYIVENSVLLAMLQSHTLKDGKVVKASKDDKSLFELAEIKDDKYTIDGISDEEFHNFRRKVKYLYGTMKGNTNSDDINNIKRTILGQALMQFRNWIPRMADERFGNLRYTGDLGVWEEGKYKSFWAQTVNKNIIPNIFNTLINGGVLGIGAGYNSKFIELKAKELYLKEREKNPNMQMTEAEYIEMHKANMKSAALELQLILTLIGVLAMLKPDDDDDKDSLRMAFIKILNRNLDEISFFANPNSTTSILKKPVPILGLATDIVGLVSDFTGETVGVLTGDEERMDKNRPIRKFNKLFPVSNALEGFWALSDPDYNKTERSKKN